MPFRNSTIAFLLFLAALINSRIGFGSDYMRNLLVGLSTMLVIVTILNGGHGLAGKCFASVSKTMADFSYTLYCCHFSIVILFIAVLASSIDLETLSVSLRLLIATGLVGLCLASAYGLSRLSEARTPFFRKVLRKIVGTFNRC